MLIRDLEHKTGLDRATIRYYEREGMIAPVRLENGYREYLDSDCETLLKVKLLRQLGMPLFRIKCLQQGSEDFSSALEDQIKNLEKSIQTSNRAKEVCQQMRQDNVSYASLDAQYYLNVLSQPAKQMIPAKFSERVHVEKHPWRRFFARMLDLYLLSSIVRFIVVVVMRIRPVSDLISSLINYGSLLLMIPVCAFLLHKFGTTPGKWTLGIRIESSNGGMLSLEDSLIREFHAYRFGMGWGIPFWEFWRMYRSYKEYRDDDHTIYDEDTEIIYSEYSTKKKLLTAALTVFCFAVIAISAFDEIKPTHLGNNLTVVQFSENYNNFVDTIYENSTPRHLKENGEWVAEQGIVINVNATEVEENKPIAYTMEDGYIRSINYKTEWTNVFYFTPLDQCMNLAASVLAAQDVGIWAGDDITDMLEQMQLQYGQKSGSIQYKNLEMYWTIETENLTIASGGYYWPEDDSNDTWISIDFTLIIN